jgi:hypothetical protein
MKKSRMVADLLAVTDVCIEASEAQARLIESCNKGPPRKKQQNNRVVNTVDHGNRENHQQQPMDQKEKRCFRHPTDAKKWCKIHRITGHDMEECKNFLDHKKIPPPQAAHEPRQSEHR